MRATFPAAGEGISTVVLSVWISTRGSSSATSCPSETSQRAISPSVSPSPRSGSLNSYATLELEQLARRVRDPLDRRHVRVLDLPVRIRDVVARDPHDRRLQVENRFLGEDGGDLRAEARGSRGLLDDHDTARLGRRGEQR